MKLKKRGQTGLLKILMNLLLVALVIFLFFGIFWLVLEGLSGESFFDQASAKSYQTLAKNLKKMTDHTDYFVSDTMILSLVDSASIVAFNRDENFSVDLCGETEKIYKPAVCGNSACICYYNPGYYTDFEKNKLSKFEPCIRFPEVEAILTYYYAQSLENEQLAADQYNVAMPVYKNFMGQRYYKFPPYYPDEKYAYFLIYGECNSWSSDYEFGKAVIYLEKSTDPFSGKTYLFIAKNTNMDNIIKRKDTISAQIKQTPEQYIALINQSFENQEYDRAIEYAENFINFYSDQPGINIAAVQEIRDKAEQEKLKQVNQLEDIYLTYLDKPPGYPPEFQNET